MADVEIKITYETLYELLRREKARDTLQELSPTFYEDVADYIKEKIRILADQQQKLNMFSISEAEKINLQLSNVRKILTDLYDRREKKIMSLAVNKSITNSNIIDTSNLLESEKKMYEHLLGILNHYRHTRFFSIIHPRQEAIHPNPGSWAPEPDPQAASSSFPLPELSSSESPQDFSSQQKIRIVRFTSAVPSFLGLKGEAFGPFDEDDIANLPHEIAEILIKKDRAEEISEDEGN